MDVLMPQLGETVAEGTVATWHKQVGDRIAVDDVLLDVETDKASMEIPSPAAGVLTKILVAAGATVDVGTVLAVIDSGDAAKVAPQAQSESAPPAAPQQQSAPEQSPPSWYAAMPPETMASETRQPAPPPASQTPAQQSAPSGSQAPAAQSSGAHASPVARNTQQRLSPAVRRLVAEHGIDVAAVNGSGRNGRITRRNVVDFLAVRQSQPEAQAPSLHIVGSRAPAPASAAPKPAASAKPAAAGSGNVLPFTRIRRLTAEHMVRSKATSPHVLQAVEVDFHRIDQVRKRVRDAWKAKHGFSLTYLPFIAHAVAEALGEFPNANASVQGDSLVLHPHVNLAIAVDLGAEGLVAPVIKSAEQLSVGELSVAISDISQRARNGRLKPDDFAGGTYTLSNSGTFGTLITAPIINQPQVAILSTDGVRKKPVVIETSDGDAIAIRPIGILAQSFDHRAIDGAYSAAFLDRVRKLLEGGNWVVEI